MNRQRGVALIAVMMVVAFVVVIAASMSGRLQLELQRQINLQQRQQSLWLALGAEQFIQRLLKKSAAGKETVNLSQEWATQGAVFPAEQAVISGSVTDLQACFNLNALQGAQRNNPNNGQNNNPGGDGQSDGQPDGQPNGGQQKNDGKSDRNGGRTGSAAQQSFLRLLEQNAVELSMPPDYLVARVTDWLDADSTLQSAGGAEENDYAALEQPYYTANSLMVSKSELRTILDVTPADYALVAPLVCVIPGNNRLQLNVNTLQEEQAALLAGIIPGLAPDDARSLIASRPEKGYDSVDDFISSNSQWITQTLNDEVKGLLSVKSEYFQAEIGVDTADSHFTLVTLYQLEGDQVKVIARRFGGPG